MDNTPIKVLLVDDDEDDYIITRDLLSEIENERFELTWIATYDAALAAIARHEHDVYLLDYRLDTRNGLELLREAIAGGCQAPLILLTGQGDHEIDLEAMKAGAADYLVKGQIGAPLLSRSIRYAIDRAQSMGALRQAEQRYRDIFEAAPVMYVITRNEGGQPVITDCNQLFLNTLGYNRPEILQRPLADFYTPASRAKLMTGGYQRALTGDFVTEERELLTRTGQIIETLLRASPETDLEGHVLGTRAMFVDITARKRAERALEEERALLARRVAERTAELSAANAKLLRAARLKDEFLANMSHELRTPLNAILGLSEVLLNQIGGPLTEQQVNFVGLIEASGHHLLALVNDILDVSKIEAGKLDLHLGQISLEKVCRASLQFVNQAALKKGINISFQLDPPQASMRADERRLKQILVNLLSNAIKFTPEGGQVGLKVVGELDQEVIHFTVWDTGIGMSDKDVVQLFKPFVQLDSRLSRRYEGAGLGLVLVFRLAELHGGSVSVESEMSRGSRFTVSLPWAASDEADQQPEWVEVKPDDPAFQRGLTCAGTPPLLIPPPKKQGGIEPLTSNLLEADPPLILLAEDNEANTRPLVDYFR